MRKKYVNLVGDLLFYFIGGIHVLMRPMRRVVVA